ncbi:ABC transporter substrate-binding protein [Roseomonas elaeocarpi]|uniref:ABC transporter substrate-binding protein n=1 Tax=Roseomonas elaeocarpi TaxID=907779 RepID=A0ABV6JQB6_9PROT
MHVVARRPLLAGLATALGGPAVARAQGTPGAPAAASPVPATATPAPVVGELRLGALFPFTGPLALLGDESFRGLEIATEERNAAGGLGGRPLRLIKGDAADANQAVAEIRRITAGEGRVSAVFGTFASTQALAAGQVAEALSLPYFELAAVADELTERGARGVFRTCPRAADFGRVSAEALTTQLAPAWGVEPRSLRVATLYEDAAYGQSVAAAQAARLREAGITPVEMLSYPPRATEIGTAMGRLRAAAPDVVLHTAHPSDVQLFFRSMREANWRPRMVMGAGGAYSLSDTARSLGEALDGVLNVDFPPFAVNEAAAPGVGAFAESYKRRYGAEARSAHSLACCVGARLCFAALEQAGGTDRDRVRAAMLALDVAEGGTANGWGARFNDLGQNTRCRPVLSQWQDGRLVTVAPAAAALAPLRPRFGGRAAQP